MAARLAIVESIRKKILFRNAESPRAVPRMILHSTLPAELVQLESGLSVDTCAFSVAATDVAAATERSSVRMKSP